VKVYVCLPPPAFPTNFGISQDVIRREIVPQLQQVAKANSATVIDLHTPLLDKPEHFPDKVHPTEKGAGLLADLVSRAIMSPMSDRRGDLSDFDRRARAGEPLCVAFFGGSLTWGANASDPQLTSYRALMSRYLRERYPKSSFNFVDAAIGGTGSKLGMFRLERDVLKHLPDLVFLDFTANDGLSEADEATLASYERLLRDLVERRIAVVQVMLGFKWNFGKDWNPEKLLRRESHLKLRDAYGTGLGDAFPFVQDRLMNGTFIDDLWPIDGAHPGDAGYRLFFEAAKVGFETAVSEGRRTSAPEKPVFADRYPVRQRIRLIDLPLPRGWKRMPTYRTSMWFDGLSSRWIGDVIACDAAEQPIEPLRVRFQGTMIGILGEADEKGLSFIAKVDGQLIKPPAGVLADGDGWTFSPARYNLGEGRLLMWQELTDKLSPGTHELIIQPVMPANRAGGQFRIESICVAGPKP
jgi:lysophospholipase L1-like esterase